MNTSFALVALYQDYENYGAHDWDGEGECPQRWKAKWGSEQVLLENLSIDDVCKLSRENYNRIIDEFGLESNDYYRHELIDYNLVEISEGTLKELFDHLCEQQDVDYFGNDLGYIRHCWKGGEYQFDVLVEIMRKRGMIDAPINKATWDVVYYTMNRDWDNANI